MTGTSRRRARPIWPPAPRTSARRARLRLAPPKALPRPQAPLLHHRRMCMPSTGHAYRQKSIFRLPFREQTAACTAAALALELLESQGAGSRDTLKCNTVCTERTPADALHGMHVKCKGPMICKSTAAVKCSPWMQRTVRAHARDCLSRQQERARTHRPQAAAHMMQQRHKPAQHSKMMQQQRQHAPALVP